MNIEQLQYVCAVARSDSMTAAATKLFVTQQTISKSIGKLERELGVQLLNRSRKGVELTDAGKAFVEKAEQILSLVQELYSIDSPSAEHVGFSGVFTLYCSDYFTYRIAAKLIAYFAKRYPRLTLHFEEHIAKDATALVLQNNHLGYITTFGEQVGYLSTSADLAQLESIDIYDDEIFVLCSRDHPLASCRSIDLHDLGEYRMVLNLNPGLQELFSREYDVDLSILMYSSSNTPGFAPIQSGIAIGLTTKSVAAASRLPENIVLVPIKQRPKAKNRFIYPKGHELSALEKEVIKQSSRILANF